MKRLLLFALSLAMFVAPALAQPILVGHRGSYYGVENTAESFINGAQRGYTYLETDVKVTKDGHHVCSHNDDTKSVGGNLTIASSTLADLQAETLSQTRGGVKYTGHLCSIKEYLDICNQYGALPLIELKWATGINSNDCSGIPALIRVIEEKGFRNKCIILTSMKPCLEYIRTHFPDITLQFLTGEYWANHFNWCVQWKIDVNIQAGYFDKSTVLKFHEQDLKVNMWTTNTADGYRTYGNMGCDFITTDYLNPQELPELDESALFPENTIDYPMSESTVKGYYNISQEYTAPFPSALSGKTILRSILHSSNWIVLAKNADGTKTIYVFHPNTGALKQTVNLGGLKISDIGLTADGYLVACNEFNSDTDSNIIIYMWDDLAGTPKELYSTSEIGINPSHSMTFGHSMAVSGRAAALKIYLSADNSTACEGILAIYTKDNVSTYNTLPAGTTLSKNSRLDNTPTCRDYVLVQQPGAMQPSEYRFDWKNSGASLAIVKTLDASVQPVGYISFLRFGRKVYAYIPTGTTSAAKCRLYDVSEGISKAYSVCSAVDAAGSYIACGLKDRNGVVQMFTMASTSGFTHYSTEEIVVEEPQNVSLQVEREWILSTTEGNAPAHIDGTNAQQGTAVNGLFYINDCVDKKIHIHNSNGYLGSIPGGSGWGCARDDRGNIVVRDDKESGSTHSFIIYPAGATVENPGTPIVLRNVDTPLSGQTNFINASGDLLGGTGRIYLYPNKQTQIAIITVEKGVVTSTRASSDLMMTGTTAGYVIPMNNDPETWIYNIRGTGLYTYNGGTSTALSTTRASTTAPARNSTGGGAYFKILGNEIFAHNSGANYKGGFTIRNHSDNDNVITSYAPIGTLGYETGGNYSTFNWLIPEKISDSAWRIYQYCPSNGIASYIIYDANTYSPAVKGDVDGDGKADTNDLALLVNILSGLATATPNSDIDGNGKVESADIGTLINIIIGF